MNLISSKIAKHVDVLKLFASIALRPVSPEQLLHYRCNNPFLRNIIARSCHVVGTRQVKISPFPLSNATVVLVEDNFSLAALLNE